MNSLESLKIDLKSLVSEETSLAFDLNDTYFEALDGAEVKRGSLHVSVSIRKATGFFLNSCSIPKAPLLYNATDA